MPFSCINSFHFSPESTTCHVLWLMVNPFEDSYRSVNAYLRWLNRVSVNIQLQRWLMEVVPTATTARRVKFYIQYWEALCVCVCMWCEVLAGLLASTVTDSSVFLLGSSLDLERGKKGLFCQCYVAPVYETALKTALSYCIRFGMDASKWNRAHYSVNTFLHVALNCTK